MCTRTRVCTQTDKHTHTHKDLSPPDRTASKAGLTCINANGLLCEGLTFVERPSLDFKSFSLFCDGFGATFPVSFLILMLLSPILFSHISSQSHAAHVHFCSRRRMCISARVVCLALRPTTRAGVEAYHACMYLHT
jgi:hypothetical protein